MTRCLCRLICPLADFQPHPNRWTTSSASLTLSTPASVPSWNKVLRPDKSFRISKVRFWSAHAAVPPANLRQQARSWRISSSANHPSPSAWRKSKTRRDAAHSVLFFCTPFFISPQLAAARKIHMLKQDMSTCVTHRFTVSSSQL